MRCSKFTVTSGLALLLSTTVLIASGNARAADAEWDHDWTVLTVGSNGAWGTATDPSRTTAIARANADCRSKPDGGRGCGSLFTTTRAGWSLAYACGAEMIVVAEKTLPEAQLSIMYREIELRQIERLDMPACELVVAIDPTGAVNTERPAIQAAERR